MRDGESGPESPADPEPLEVQPSMPTAVEKVAAALAKRQAGAAAPAKTKPAPEPEPDDEVTDDEEVVEHKPATKMTPAERRAAREARVGKIHKVAEPEEPTDDDSDDEADEADEPEPTPVKAKKPMARPTTKAKGKKAPSPAQIAAREAFAERSRAKAAANRKPVQTEAEIKAKQNADRRQANEVAAEAASPKGPRTGKPSVVKKALTGNALKAHQAKLAKEAAAEAKKAKAPAKKAAARAPREAGATKTKVLDLWAKGLNRRQIAEKLDVSYASVFFHTKGEVAEGGNVGARGRVFVDDPLHKGRGKAEQVSRSEAMRRCYESLDMSIGDISRQYGVRYQIAYTAIRPLLVGEDDD